MAIDTRQKRFSMINFGQTPMAAMFEADGAVDADDRPFLLGLYSGIALDAPGAGDVGIPAIDGTGAPDYVDSGLPYDDGVLAVDSVSSITHHSNGLAFTANGRLAVAISDTINHMLAAIPRGVTGRVSIADEAITHYASGRPYTETSHLSIDLP